MGQYKMGDATDEVSFSLNCQDLGMIILTCLCEDGLIWDFVLVLMGQTVEHKIKAFIKKLYYFCKNN